MARSSIGGDVAEGFAPVVAAFRRNFERRGDVGAALAVFRHGRPLVDLWGGLRDAERGLPWKRDTMVPVFSTTKGVAALVTASLVSRGLLDYDAPVTRYWPQFGQHGKQDVTVAQLLAHGAGVPVLDPVLRRADLLDLDALALVLAAQCPAWAPGTRTGYHAITLGLYQNELVRRADPARRSIGRVLAEDFAKPLGLGLHIGLPPEVDMDRIAVLGRLATRDALRQLPGVPWRLALRLANRSGLAARSLANPRLGAPERFARREVLTPEVPSSNGVGDARSLAVLYSAAASGAPALPIDAGVLARLAEPAGRRVELDVLLRARRAYAYGFSKPVPGFAFGSPAAGDPRGHAFGASGLGGSFAFADPDTGVGYAYAPNRLGIRLGDDPRETSLRRAVFACLEATGG